MRKHSKTFNKKNDKWSMHVFFQIKVTFYSSTDKH